MNISVEKLLQKMEEKLKEAKGSGSNAVIRERVHSIKTMCELILEEPSKTSLGSKTVPLTENIPTSVRVVSTSPNQQERLVIDNESNGESIFDF